MLKPLSYYQQYIHSLSINVELKRVQQLTQGLNNLCFKLESDTSQPLLLKQFKQLDSYNNVSIEQHFATTGIAPEIIANDKAHLSIIYRFIDSQSYDANVHLTNLVDKIKQIHALPFDKQMTTIKLNSLIDSYSSLDEFAPFEKGIKACLEQLTHLPDHLGFCHNDLVKENLLFEQSQVWIIDFEYSAWNDVFFDLAAICQSLNLTDKQQLTMLATYFECEEVKPIYLEKLTRYRQIYNLICYFWYLKKGEQTRADKLLPFLNALIA